MHNNGQPNVHTPPASAALSEREREQLIGRWRALRAAADAFVAARPAMPPFPVEQLVQWADALADSGGVGVASAIERKLLAIMIHNAAWRETLAEIPFERRLLLLPQCLRAKARCPAQHDAFGLLCVECGNCPLGGLQRQADALGYVTLIAEGATAVGGLLETGKVEAVIGASCLPALEQTFRRIAEQAVPAQAIPLLRHGCDATDVDLQWLEDAIRLRGPRTAPALASLDTLQLRVQDWFGQDALQTQFGPSRHHAAGLALAWMARGGKRWRPLLTCAVYDALASPASLSPIRAVAVATECFHKASLIHDDIEDEDELRDGQPSLHSDWGIPIAVNVGDLLLGEGYRLLAQAPFSDATRVRMLAAAAEAHRRLCLGQGEELRQRDAAQRPPTLREALRVFQGKTVPAFEVALSLGALAGGADATLCRALRRFSLALGIAYQIQDDLRDARQDGATLPDASRHTPSILAALASREGGPAAGAAIPRQRAEQLLAAYRRRAFEALTPIREVRLKSMLMRLTARILV